jgi:hypothetical protein
MRRYAAFGWVVWKIMGRVARRKVARNRARLVAAGVLVAVVGAGIGGARARGD